jgi:protein O-GlcNAc transferase
MKITEATVQAWARLMHGLPGSRLIMFTVAAGSAQRRARDLFAMHGIAGARLELLPRLDAAAYLAARNRVDIALDPFPVNGGTTTCDSLWMGVPTITLAGQVFVSRAGLSLLSNAGLPELVAHTIDDYIGIAAALGADLPRLEQLRKGLRQRMLDSPLTDGPRFVGNLEALYRQAWHGWCERAPC